MEKSLQLSSAFNWGCQQWEGERIPSFPSKLDSLITCQHGKSKATTTFMMATPAANHILTNLLISTAHGQNHCAPMPASKYSGDSVHSLDLISKDKNLAENLWCMCLPPPPPFLFGVLGKSQRWKKHFRQIKEKALFLVLLMSRQNYSDNKKSK